MNERSAARSRAALWLRLAETALLGVGISLLVQAFTATVETRTYQTRQERALVERARDPHVAISDADPLVLGRIDIPRVGVSAIVRDGDDAKTLALAVGPERRYVYRVDWIRVVRPEDTGVLRPTGNPSLTLVTCFPFYYVGAAPKRYVVRASRVEDWGLPGTETVARKEVASSVATAALR